MVVRDPVTRAISDYTQAASKKQGMKKFEELAFSNETYSKQTLYLNDVFHFVKRYILNRCGGHDMGASKNWCLHAPSRAVVAVFSVVAIALHKRRKANR